MGTWRGALVPLVPRPAVLPLDASPRPTLVFALCAPGAGRRWCSLSPRPDAPCSPVVAGPVLADPVLAGPVLADAVLVDPALVERVLVDPVLVDAVVVDSVLVISGYFLHRDQVAHGLDHAAELRPIRLDDHLADFAQPQRPQRITLRAGPADLRLDLCHFQLCHLSAP